MFTVAAGSVGDDFIFPPEDLRFDGLAMLMINLKVYYSLFAITDVAMVNVGREARWPGGFSGRGPGPGDEVDNVRRQQEEL